MIITDWMNDLDFVSMTLGNHEYDWGEEYIEKNAEAAEFPFLAINVYEKETGERVDYCRSSVLIERDGMKIGIIGAIGDCYSSISGEMVEDIYFKTGSELTALVKAESEKLRAEGADIVVYSLHDGYGKSMDTEGIMVKDEQIRSYYDISLSDGYVDLVFEGHTHANYVLEDSKGVYHLQNGGDNRGISHAEITLNFANGIW
jgi:2',3'-cyclic-nucleotide 2'-phosphodiesterase (5'-nucleotidase family)